MTRHAYLMPVTWSAQFWCGFLLLLVTPAPPAPGGGAAPMLAMCESWTEFSSWKQKHPSLSGNDGERAVPSRARACRGS